VDAFGTPGWTPVVGIGGYHQKCAHFLSQARVIFSKNNFTPSSVLSSFLNQSGTEIRESSWCERKDPIVRINKAVDFDPALPSYIKSEFDTWNEGECIHIRKAGK